MGYIKLEKPYIVQIIIINPIKILSIVFNQNHIKAVGHNT